MVNIVPSHHSLAFMVVVTAVNAWKCCIKKRACSKSRLCLFLASTTHRIICRQGLVFRPHLAWKRYIYLIRRFFLLEPHDIIIPEDNSAHYVRFEIFTAGTMQTVVFWDIQTQFVLHRRHITSPLPSPAG
jgi:hypothetical protein